MDEQPIKLENMRPEVPRLPSFVNRMLLNWFEFYRSNLPWHAISSKLNPSPKDKDYDWKMFTTAVFGIIVLIIAAVVILIMYIWGPFAR